MISQLLWKMVPLAIAWFDWLEQKRRIFDDKASSSAAVVWKIMANTIQWPLPDKSFNRFQVTLFQGSWGSSIIDLFLLFV